MSRAREFADLAGSADAGGLTGRNLIINGAMQVAQRGTSAATKTNLAYHTVDRFKIGPNSMGTFTHTQESDGPAGFTKSVKLECTTADASPAANDSITIQNIIEAQDLQHLNKGSSDAKSVTLSFYVKSNKTGTYTAELFEDDNSRHNSKTFSVSSSGTWEYKTITFEGDTSGAMNNDNGVGFYVLWHLGAGSNFTSGTLGTSWQANDTADRVSSSNVNLADTVGNYFQLTGVQLEVGKQATPFEHRSFGDELFRCQRYFYRWISESNYGNLCMGVSINTTKARGLHRLPVEMRSQPTFSSNGTFRIAEFGGHSENTSAESITRNHKRTPYMNWTISNASLTQGKPAEMGANNDDDAFCDFDAEL